MRPQTLRLETLEDFESIDTPPLLLESIEDLETTKDLEINETIVEFETIEDLEILKQ